MKKTVALILAATLLLSLISGCAEKKPAAGSAENEIVTYTPIDPARTTLYISNTGNTRITGLSEAFEALNPDVQIIALDITGGSSDYTPTTDWVTSGQAPDIMFTTPNTLPREIAAQYFVNLSNSPVIASYESEALNNISIDGNIYWLPGPSIVNAMTYNKTLFEKYGWSVPKTFDEFVALCVKIRTDTNGEIQPWNPNAKYDGEFAKVMEGFLYEQLFAGIANRTWYEDFCDGKATFAGHMEPYYEAAAQLIDNKLLFEEHFSYSATTRGKEFEAGKIAMINCNVTSFGDSEFEFEFMPYPSTSGNEGYICHEVNYCVGIPKKEHTAAEQDAIDRYIAFFSSAQGQKAFIGDLLMISNVKGVELEQSEKLAALKSAIDKGHSFELLRFESELGSPRFSFLGDTQLMLREGKTGAERIAEIDAEPYIPTVEKPAPEVLATAAENFTILETSFYLADMYREKTGADIALINNNVAYRGNLMKIFKGELTANHATVLKPRSFGNDSKLTKAAMTGQQLLDALNEPLGNEEATDSVYAYSGLKCEVAPWKPLGQKYISVTLFGGTKISPEATYTIAFWSGTVYDKYITRVLQEYEGTFEELLTEKLAADKTIAPANDGRIKLLWE